MKKKNEYLCTDKNGGIESFFLMKKKYIYLKIVTNVVITHWGRNVKLFLMSHSKYFITSDFIRSCCHSLAVQTFWTGLHLGLQRGLMDGGLYAHHTGEPESTSSPWCASPRQPNILHASFDHHRWQFILHGAPHARDHYILWLSHAHGSRVRDLPAHPSIIFSPLGPSLSDISYCSFVSRGGDEWPSYQHGLYLPA